MTQDILITPGSGEPQILFRGSGTNDTPIELNVLSSYQSATGSGTALVFEGQEGQLFAVTDNLSSGTIFSVGDITGLSMLSVDASGDVKLGEFANSVIVYPGLTLDDNVPSTTSNVLYNDGGDLMWNGVTVVESGATQAVDGSGTAGQVAFFSDTNTIASESNLYWDSANNRLGINTSSPSSPYSLHVNGYALIQAGTQPTLKIDAINTSSPSYTANIELNGYGGRGQGIFFKDKNYANEEWFMGMPYIGYFDKFQIGYDSAGGQSEYEANSFFTINSAGNVGIGESSPTHKLHITGPADSSNYSQLMIESEGTYPDTMAGIVLNSVGSHQSHVRFMNNGTLKFQIRYNSGNTTEDKLKFYSWTQAADMVTFDGATGRVGIGTTSPSEKLHVAGDVLIDGDGTTIAGATWNNGLLKVGSSSDGISIDTNEIYGSNALVLGSLDNSNHIMFKHGTVERMRVASGGNIGINTTSPQDKLHVNGGRIRIENVTDPKLSFNDGSANRSEIFYDTSEETFVLNHTDADANQLVLTSGNDVGIGTNDPNATLHVYSATSGENVFNVEGTNGSLFGVTDNLSGVLMSVNTIAGLPVLEVNSDYSVTAGRFNQNDFVITSGGYVGMGTDTPLSKLHVEGGIRTIDGIYFKQPSSTEYRRIYSNSINDLYLENLHLRAGYSVGVGNNRGTTLGMSYTSSDLGLYTASNERIRITSGGNVGIGTSSPAAKLDVNGQVRIDSVSAVPTNCKLLVGDVIEPLSSVPVQMDGPIRLRGGLLIHDNTTSANSSYLRYSTTDGLRIYRNAGSGSQNISLAEAGGDVGIGTTSPQQKLHVVGDQRIENATDPKLEFHDGAAVGAYVKFDTSEDNLVLSHVDVAGDNQIALANDGNVGIGTASPNAVLHAYGSTPSGTVFNVEGTNGSLFSVVDNLSGVLMSVNNNAGLPVFEVNDDDSIIAGRFAQDDFVITSSGDIGMGTANPSSKLEVNGTVTATCASLGQLNVDNLRLDGNTLSSTNFNGNINITPNGTGGIAGGTSATVTGSYATVGGGTGNCASGYASTVSGGYGNTASGIVSIVGGGVGNCATDFGSTISGGSSNCASGSCSTVGGGYSNTASGYASTVGGGYSNTASGYASTVGGGYNNTASGFVSIVGGGVGNCASASYSTVSGGCNNCACATHSSVSGGKQNFVNARHGSINGGHRNVIQSPTNECCSRGVTIGGGVGHNTSGGTLNSTTGDLTGTITCCNAGRFSTISGGLRNIATGWYSTLSGGQCNTASGSYSTVGGGSYNTASGSSNSTVGGGFSNCASGIYSTVGGGLYNTASGYSSTVGGGGAFFAGNTASGNISTVSGGAYNIASGSLSTVSGGDGNTASGAYSTVSGGRSNTASGCRSTVIGGFRAKASRFGEVAHAAGRFAQNGDAQHSTFVARKNTTDATANIELFLDSSSQRMTLTAETTWTFDIKLSAYNDTDNTAAWWIFRGGIRRNAANVTTLIGSLIEERDYEGTMSGTSAAVTADDTNESLKIAVTGLASKNIRWVAVVDVAQVSWGTP